ncbi:hypothetical protein FA09DRAFT_250274 [Tilletiopsis washingtonensis]|uniref:Uncharacterized protein n=1 Tax=Tilletiopsis washingtonensis TaxID=58919 RepID=A0A316ZAZ1_9BASI|nr:hypothetical protein FA09DRAFT_250274 [Tilletiopsis washingtonensis]PWN98751.1 hypothetical protein FA09DRAFT_250274 [Tilletiopsis washingtonensis]
MLMQRSALAPGRTAAAAPRRRSKCSTLRPPMQLQVQICCCRAAVAGGNPERSGTSSSIAALRCCPLQLPLASQLPSRRAQPHILGPSAVPMRCNSLLPAAALCALTPPRAPAPRSASCVLSRRAGRAARRAVLRSCVCALLLRCVPAALLGCKHSRAAA